MGKLGNIILILLLLGATYSIKVMYDCVSYMTNIRNTLPIETNIIQKGDRYYVEMKYDCQCITDMYLSNTGGVSVGQSIRNNSFKSQSDAERMLNRYLKK